MENVTGYRVYRGKDVSKWFHTREAAEDFYRQDDTATWITEEKEEKITVKIEYWPKEKFKGREVILRTKSAEIVLPVRDEDIGCDVCNDDITDFPVAVSDGKAYCKKCESKWLRKE